MRQRKTIATANHSQVIFGSDSRQNHRGWTSSYGAAVLAVAAAILLRTALTPVVGPTVLPFTLFFPAVLFAAWFGGFWPGLLSIGLSTLAAAYRFADPAGYFRIVSRQNQIELLVFVLAGFGVALLSHSQRHAVDRASRAEKAERNERRRFKATLASIGDAVIATDERGNITFLNKVAASLMGTSLQSALGKHLDHVFRIVNEFTREKVESPVSKVLREGKIVGMANHTVLIAQDGTEIPIDDSAAPIRGESESIEGTVLVFRDVSERRRADLEREARLLAEHEMRIAIEATDKLKKAETKFRGLLEAAPDAMIVVDPEGKIVLANAQVTRVFGYEDQELVGRSIEELLPERFRALHPKLREGYWAEGQTRAMADGIELYALHKDGREFPTEVRLSPVQTDEGVLVTSAVRDVSERKAQERRIARQAELLNAANDAIWAVDGDDRITYWNSGAERLYGWNEKETMGKIPRELLHTEFPVPFDEIQKHRSEGGWGGELVHTTRDGTKVTVASRWTTLRDERGDIGGWLVINTDVSERKRAEENLRSLSVRLMNAQDEERRRIARELHDSVGQYLAHAKMSIDSFQRKFAPGGKDMQLLSDVVDSLTKCLNETRTISHLLHPPLLDELGFASAARLYTDGFSQRSGITVNLDLPPDLSRLPAALELILFRMLQEALTNIHRHAQSKFANIHVQIDKDDITLAVRDYGKGMPQELLHKVRSTGAGCGVGLTGMRERIVDFRGKFEIDSNESGTLIRATLPLSGAARMKGGSTAAAHP